MLSARYKTKRQKLLKCLAQFIIVSCYLYFNRCYAVNFNIIPTLQLQEIFSDNVQLAPPGSEQSAFVSEVDPGIAIIGRTARTRLNLNYRMQNLYNAQGDNTLTTANQLQYNSSNVLVQNKLFLNSFSSISQQNLNTNQVAVDNISGSPGSRTTVTTFGISPYWTPTIGHYANARVGVQYNSVSTGANSSNTTSSGLGTITDTNTLAENIQINSGTRFGRISWGLSFNNSDSYEAGQNNNVNFQNSNAIVRRFINKNFNIFAQAGYSNNNFQTSTTTNQNGFFYTFGGKWMPSRHYSLEAGYGNNRYVTLYISPMQRFTWVTTLRDNSIGLNSGRVWQTALNYRTRRSIWSVTHINDTTTTQAVLSQLQVFSTQDALGNTIQSPSVNNYINLPTLTNEVIVSESWNASVSYFSGKTGLSFNGYNQNRVYQVEGISQKVTGINTSWNWRFSAKTSVYLMPTWQQTDTGATVASPASNNQLYYITLGVRQAITRKAYGSLEIRHLKQSSDVNTNDYQENRATASLFMRF